MGWGASLISDRDPTGRQMEHFLSAVTNEWTKTWKEDVSQPGLWTQPKLKAAGTIIRWRCTIRRGWQERLAWLRFLKLALQHESRRWEIKNDAPPIQVSGALCWSALSSWDFWWTSMYENCISVTLTLCQRWSGFKQPRWRTHTQQRPILHIHRCSKLRNCQQKRHKFKNDSMSQPFCNLDFGSINTPVKLPHIMNFPPKQAKRTPACSAVLPFYPDEGETCGSSLFTCEAMPK